MHFAVGKVYMDLDDPDQAFDYFQRGNTLKRERATYSAAATSEHVDRLIAFFDSDRFEQIGTDFASLCRLPIFIVGMPRSGTTLVEQIIASHPVVSSAGELNDLRRVSERLSLVTKSDDDFPECIAGLEPRNARRLAAGYIERLTSLAPDAQRVIDKMPWNFHALGMIAMFWPRAKIIYCVRDAVDTCVSCYTRYFQAGQPFSWDLAELGHYYRQQQRLADHWREVLPIPILEVPYEQMVAEQEEMSRKLIDFCGLEWDNRCLEFHKTDRVIKTNPLGVRRPVYRTSIGRAEKFGAHLDPLRQALAGDLQPSS